MAIFSGGDGADTFAGTDGPDTIFGGRGQDNLSGGGGNDSFTASTDADVLNGGAGDDVFQLNVCALVIGGEGHDTFKFGTPSSSISPNDYDLGAQTIITDFNVNEDVIDLSGQVTRSIPALFFSTIRQSAYDPFASGVAWLRNTADGVQIMWGDKPMVILLGVTSGQLTASNFTSVQRIELNFDTGQTTTTTVVIDPRNSPNGSVLDGGAGPDTVTGTAANDTVRGLDGNDSIVGLAGNDDLNGNVGSDIVNGGAGADWVRGGKDNDTIDGGDDSDPHVNGNIGNDIVHGGAGNDTVYGGQDNDTVYGDAGDDSMSGDLGDDQLYGGAGADRYWFAPGQGRDWIMDWNFAEGDRLYLPHGQAYTVTSYMDQVMIEMGGGAGIGFQLITPSSFSSGWIVLV